VVIQALITTLPVEALRVRVLKRLAGPAEAEREPPRYAHASSGRPANWGLLSQTSIWAEVDRLRQALEHPHGVGTRQGSINSDRDARARNVVVDDVQSAEAAVVRERETSMAKTNWLKSGSVSST